MCPVTSEMTVDALLSSEQRIEPRCKNSKEAQLSLRVPCPRYCQSTTHKFDKQNKIKKSILNQQKGKKNQSSKRNQGLNLGSSRYNSLNLFARFELRTTLVPTTSDSKWYSFQDDPSLNPSSVSAHILIAVLSDGRTC